MEGGEIGQGTVILSAIFKMLSIQHFLAEGKPPSKQLWEEPCGGSPLMEAASGWVSWDAGERTVPGGKECGQTAPAAPIITEEQEATVSLTFCVSATSTGPSPGGPGSRVRELGRAVHTD